MKTSTEYVFSQIEVSEMTILALGTKLKEMGVDIANTDISFKGLDCEGRIVFSSSNYEERDEDRAADNYGQLDTSQDCMVVQVVTKAKSVKPAAKRTRSRRSRR